MGFRRTKRFNVSQQSTVIFKSKHGWESPRTVCPDCLTEGHEQMETDEAYDCKNLFIDDDGNIEGQCCCYSKEHGLRES